MTENTSTSPPQGSRSTPHIRLNSGRQDPFVDMDDGGSSQRSQSPATRTLTPGPQSPGLPPGTAVSSPHYASNAGSSELLIPPPRHYRSRDESEPPRSPSQSVYSSRRTSWDSEAGSRDSRAYPYDPFSDSRAPSMVGSDDDNVNTQTVSEKYNITPSEGLLLFPEDVEKDDYLHNPDPNDKDRDCDICNTRGLVNVGGLALLTLGILALFIAYPVVYGVPFIPQIFHPRVRQSTRDPSPANVAFFFLFAGRSCANSLSRPMGYVKETPCVWMLGMFRCSRTFAPVSLIPIHRTRRRQSRPLMEKSGSWW